MCLLENACQASQCETFKKLGFIGESACHALGDIEWQKEHGGLSPAQWQGFDERTRNFAQENTCGYLELVNTRLDAEKIITISAS